MTKIKEIFSSIQGEGKYIGYNQIFVRFCECNLKCKYCDTDFLPDSSAKDYSPLELANYITNNFNKDEIHSISLTGGEPLLFTDFLSKFLPLLSEYKIYLETNATLYKLLPEVIDYIDIIAADIKLESSTGISNILDVHDKFFNIAKNKDMFAKIVFDENISDDEISDCVNLAKKYSVPLILQPVTINNKITVCTELIVSIFNKFLSQYDNVRLIPQIHKFINVP